MWNEVVEKYPGLPGNVFSSYVSLWARLPEITLPDIVDSFEQTVELIRVPGIRGALMTSTPQTYSRIYPAFKTNLEKAFAAHLRSLGVDDGLLRLATDEILEVLGTEDLTAREISRKLVRFKSMKSNVLAGILGALCADRVLVRARVHGDLVSPQVSYAAWDHWVPYVPPTPYDFKLAIGELSAQYFDAYPNATVEDFQAWGRWDEVQLHRIQQELEYSRLISAAPPLIEIWPGWHLLPPLDAFTTAYRSPRTWLPPDLRDWVFDASGNATSVILEDGQCVGIWDLIQVEDILYEARIAFFNPQARITFELDQRIASLAKFLDIEVGDAIQVRPDRSLKEAGPDAYRSPLKDAVLQ